ncbi:hypothetical protein ACJ41O_013057 [Fusarium nematophilum]
MSTSTSVGWYGLGSMGLPMALNLQKKLQSQGSSLAYSNRTLAKGGTLEEAGAIPKDTFLSVVQDCDDVFTMVSSDKVLETLIDEVMSQQADIRGKTFIDCSTIHPQTALSVAERLRLAGAEFIAAPVFGASPVAEAGRLIFAMSGSQTDIQRLEPLVQDVMGRKVLNLGPNVTKSPMLKITGNVLLVTFLEAIAETQVLAELNGVGTFPLEDLIFENFGPVLGSYSRRMTSGSWAPAEGWAGFGVSNAIKDARHALRVAGDLGARMPALDVATNNMLKEGIVPERAILKATVPDAEVEVYHPITDGVLPDATKFDAVTLAGGVFNLTLPKVDPWVEQTLAFIRDTAENCSSTEMVAVCWGHQAITRAMGGEIEFNPHFLNSTRGALAVLQLDLSLRRRQRHPALGLAGSSYKRECWERDSGWDDGAYAGGLSEREVKDMYARFSVPPDGERMFQKVVDWIFE